jgi:hypothetical protein
MVARLMIFSSLKLCTSVFLDAVDHLLGVGSDRALLDEDHHAATDVAAGGALISSPP